MKAVIHGSFRKHFAEIARTRALFEVAGIEVIAPDASEIAGYDGGFAVLASDTETDQRMIELLYLRNLKRLGPDGFSYFVNPGGYVGKSAAYELGIASATNVRCFFSDAPDDLPAFVPKAAVVPAEALAAHVARTGALPSSAPRRDERKLRRLWEELLVPGSVVAVGGIIEYDGADARAEKDVLMVRTHKWGGRWSIVGGKVRRNERLDDAYLREIREETGLAAGVGRHLCTFDQIRGSGYYLPTQHVFVDKVARVASRRVRLNHEAQEHLWLPARAALAELDIEPNARHTLELYAAAA
jgi:ADP-ribose pyrophosphatase YjhB (NUDIX family)